MNLKKKKREGFTLVEMVIVVTILGVLGVLVILFFGYTSSIKKQTNPVSMPTAAEKINPKTKTLLFSDSLNFEKANTIYSYFKDKHKIEYSSNLLFKENAFNHSRKSSGCRFIKTREYICDGLSKSFIARYSSVETCYSKPYAIKNNNRNRFDKVVVELSIAD